MTRADVALSLILDASFHLPPGNAIAIVVGLEEQLQTPRCEKERYVDPPPPRL